MQYYKGPGVLGDAWAFICPNRLLSKDHTPVAQHLDGYRIIL